MGSEVHMWCLHVRACVYVILDADLDCESVSVEQAT